MNKAYYVILVSFFVFLSCKSTHKNQEIVSEELINILSPQEVQDGWKLLFDGKSFNGWQGVGKKEIQKDNWKIENGNIRKLNNEQVEILSGKQSLNGGDLMTIKTYNNYELYFEWKLSKAGNSGVKYNVSEEISKMYGKKNYAVGFEYQLLDDADEKYAGKIEPSQFTASLYDLIPAVNGKTKQVGEYNSSKILVIGNHIEHWLNGQEVLTFELGSQKLDSLWQISKFNKTPNFLVKHSGHIVLQNHKDDAWFRNIKIREIHPKSE
ncbi:MAG: DUF1080 domain-containing protein [Ferruginibacter sp.]